MKDVLNDTRTELVKTIGYQNIINAVRSNIEMMSQSLGHDPFPLKHSFAEGLYIREILIPKGYFVVGAGHYESYENFVLSGDMSVLTPEGVQRVKGPCHFVSPAGTQRFGFSHEDTVWVTVHKNPENLTDLDKLDKLIHDREPKIINTEIPENIPFDAKRFRYLTERIYTAEKEGFWSDFTEEQQKIYMSGDWEAFSRSRGYTEEEISELREWIELKEDAEERGINALALVSDLIYTCAIKNVLKDVNGEIALTSHMPSSKKHPYKHKESGSCQQ